MFSRTNHPYSSCLTLPLESRMLGLYDWALVSAVLESYWHLHESLLVITILTAIDNFN